MRSTSSSVSPYLGLTRWSVRCRSAVPFAPTLRMPSASIWNCTSTRGMPAGIGGMPRSLNRPGSVVRDELAFALHDVDVDGRLVVDVRREHLACRWPGSSSCAG